MSKDQNTTTVRTLQSTKPIVFWSENVKNGQAILVLIYRRLDYKTLKFEKTKLTPLSKRILLRAKILSFSLKPVDITNKT